MGLRSVVSLVALGCLALSGCTPMEGGIDLDRPRDVYPIGGDAGPACARPEDGCACEPGAPPIDCYLEPETTPEGAILCTAGTRYCRDGAWTACESLRSYQLLGRQTSVIGTPTECNDCDPSCAVTRDAPDDSDLDSSNSDGVEYDTTAGGVGLEGTLATATLTDSDGDGTPDAYDDYPLDPARDGITEAGGIFHTLGFGDSAGPDPLTFDTTIQTADVYLLIDRTGSMGDEIANIQTSLTSGTFNACSGGIIGAIQCIIPDAWIGVGDHGDFPVAPYGSSSDPAYRHLQDVTSNASDVQTAVNGITASGGSDWPESHSSALWSMTTGGALGTYVSAQTGCAAGRWGYPCFRDDTIPIVIMITDAPWHNGPSTDFDYDSNYFGTITESAPSQSYISGNHHFSDYHNFGDITGGWVGARGDTSIHTHNYSGFCNAGSGGDVAFRFSLTSSQITTISTEGSSYDTVIYVRRVGDAGGSCNDDYTGLGTASKMVLSLTPGTYEVLVDGFGSSDGDYRLRIGDPCVTGTCTAGYSPPSWAATVAELNTRGVRVLGVESSGGYSDALTNLEDLADATNSVDSLGAPFVFSIANDGTGISDSIVDAVEDLAEFSRSDVSARATDDPSTTGVDERDFVNTLTASSYPSGRCTGISGDGTVFLSCLPGTNVQFNATFRNDIVMPTTVDQVFDFTIEIIGGDIGAAAYVLDTVPVRIVVPSTRVTYPDPGSYWHDYDATTYCADNERPDWGSLTWNTDVPTGTSIEWQLRTASTIAGLDSANAVTFTEPGTTPPVDVAAQLVGAGEFNFLPYLRVTAVLMPDSGLNYETPLLYNFETTFTCTPTE